MATVSKLFSLEWRSKTAGNLVGLERCCRVSMLNYLKVVTCKNRDRHSWQRSRQSLSQGLYTLRLQCLRASETLPMIFQSASELVGAKKDNNAWIPYSQPSAWLHSFKAGIPSPRISKHSVLTSWNVSCGFVRQYHWRGWAGLEVGCRQFQGGDQEGGTRVSAELKQLAPVFWFSSQNTR